MQDPDVPWRHALALVEHLPGDAVVTPHQGRRPPPVAHEDIARLIAAVEGITQS